MFKIINIKLIAQLDAAKCLCGKDLKIKEKVMVIECTLKDVMMLVLKDFIVVMKNLANFQIAVPIRRTNKLGWQSFTGIPKTRNHLERIAACHSKA